MTQHHHPDAPVESQAPPPVAYDSFAPPPAPPPHQHAVQQHTLPRRAGFGLLIAGLVIGAGAAYGISRAALPGETVHIAIDDTPLKAPTTNAEGVARRLVPAVGTIIALQG